MYKKLDSFVGKYISEIEIALALLCFFAIGWLVATHL